MRFPEVALSRVSAIPITNGLGEAATDGDVTWPRYIRTTDITDVFRLDPGKRVTLPPETARGAMLEAGDILMTAAGSLGTSYLFDGEEPSCYAGYLVRFRPRSDRVDFRYAAYWTKSAHHIHQLNTGAVRSTIDNFSAGKFRQMKMPLPPLDEQRRIADFLDDQVTGIEQASHLKGLESQALSVLVETMLSDAYDQQSDDSGSARLRVGLRSIRQGWSPQCEDRLPEGEEWGVLRAGCVNNGTFRPDDLKALPADIAARPEFLVSVGDLLVNRASGSVDLIGSCALVSEDVRPRTLLCDKVYKLVLGPQWLPEYVVQMWRTRQVREALRLGVSGAEGMANSLPSSVISSTRLPMLPIRTQRAWLDSFDRTESDIRTALDLLDRSRALLTDYKLELISRAVTGQLDVSTARRGLSV